MCNQPYLDSYKVDFMDYSGGTEGMKTFAERIKQVRQDRKYTQQQLAEIINVSVHTISNYEQGICEPSCVTLLELAKVLDVTPEFLLLGENNMNNYTNAIKAELMQLTDFDKIAEIKAQELNSTILSHLEMSDELVETIKNQWNMTAIFKRKKDGVVEDSYCTRNYVQEVIIRYCQNHTMFKERFDINDGMLLNM